MHFRSSLLIASVAAIALAQATAMTPPATGGITRHVWSGVFRHECQRFDPIGGLSRHAQQLGDGNGVSRSHQRRRQLTARACLAGCTQRLWVCEKGGDLEFGPDGYLYMSWGDEGNQNDSRNNGQVIDKDFWSSITRMDVDLEPEDYSPSDGTGGDDSNLPPNDHPAIVLRSGAPLYEVPSDNPWVGATTFNGVAVDPTEVRTEFFAVGFRNPWRFSFDKVTGELWAGDVGQGAWEEVAVIDFGSNHGWAWREGKQSGPKNGNLINGASQTSATLIDPEWDYGHGSGEFQGNSVTGGVVYRGTGIPELTLHPDATHRFERTRSGGHRPAGRLDSGRGAHRTDLPRFSHRAFRERHLTRGRTVCGCGW